MSRVVQAQAGDLLALARAVVRDTAAKDKAASMIGHPPWPWSCSPMVAPFIGGVLDEAYGWRSISVAMAAMALVVAVAA